MIDMPVKKSASNEYVKQVVGEAVIKITGNKPNSIVQVKFADPKNVFANGKTFMQFPLDDEMLPKTPNLKSFVKNWKEGDKVFEARFSVRLNKEADGVESILPLNGAFNAKFVRFTQVDGVPMWFEKEDTKWNRTLLKFTAFYEITDGVFKGCIAPYFLQYKLTSGLMDGREVAVWDGDPFDERAKAKGWNVYKLYEWCEIHKVFEKRLIEWGDGNALPEMERRALENNVPVQITFKGGWLNDLNVKDDYSNFIDLEEDEELAEEIEAANNLVSETLADLDLGDDEEI